MIDPMIEPIIDPMIEPMIDPIIDPIIDPMIDPMINLRDYRIKHVGKLIFATLNINSIRYKFDELKSLISGNIDVLVVTETKLDDSFPTVQFFIDGYSMPYRLDRNKHGGGILIYIREDISSKQLTKHTFKDDMEGIFIELNLNKYKLLVLGTYHPPNQDNQYYFNTISNSLDLYLRDYSRFLLMGDFNITDSEPIFSDFIDQYDAKNIVKGPTCFKSVTNPSTIDLFVTNAPRSFWNTRTFENSLSDFHSLVTTVLNIKYVKPKPKQVTYRNYKNFVLENFQRDLLTVFSSGCSDYETFETMFLSTLNMHAPLKKKMIRGNHAPYFNRNIRKAIMKRNELHTKFNKSHSEYDKGNFKKQRKLVTKLLYREKKKYYHNLDDKVILDNKKFWKQIKSSFSDKVICGQKITLVKDNTIISVDQEQAEAFKLFFEDAVSRLDIQENQFLLNYESGDLNDEIGNIILRFKYHPSILKIQEKVNIDEQFEFTQVNDDDVYRELKGINPRKATTFQNIPCKSLRDNAEVCTPVIRNIFNTKIVGGLTFSDKLKVADIAPVFKSDRTKKKDATNVENYRPVSVLPSTSKIFERLLQKQIGNYISSNLSPYLCGYRRGYSAQHALISLIEHWRKALDSKGYAGAVLMDLSKAFDCINYDLLIAKLHAYGFSKQSLKLIKSYLSNRKQRVKVNNSFSTWFDLIMGLPQGSVLGPLLFNIYLNDLFWINEYTDVCNLADDTTLYASDIELKNLMLSLEHDSLLAIEWFESNYMKLNTDKCHLIVGGSKHEQVFAKIGENIVWEGREYRLLGVTIEKQLKFDTQIKGLIKTAHQKLSALIRYARILNFEKRRTLMKSFIEAQFGYSPLTWMFHNRYLENLINRVHERALRCVYLDDVSSFSELLKKDKSFPVHHRNIQAMAIEMYKTKNKLEPEVILNNIFILNENRRDGMRSSSDFLRPRINSVHFGEDSLQYFGSVIWDKIPIEIRNSESLSSFKSKIRNWSPDECTCRLCRDYVYRLGYVNAV
jgi:exonuclease III